jgi:AraC family transcriptional regulator
MNQAQSIIERGLQYIESHLKEKISLDDIAQNVGLSKYHLDRIFKSLTGETLISYTTSRKLTSSLYELLNTNMKIIDIAFEYGFEHEQSYIRTFRKQYGRTPLKVRTGSEKILVKERINIQDITAVDNAITYQPFFVIKPAFQLIGIKHTIPLEADYLIPNNVGLDFFYHQKQQIKNVINPSVYIGYVDWSSLQNGYTTYFPSVQVKPGVEIPAGMSSLAIPAYKYVVFRFVGFFNPDQVNISHFYHLLEYMYSKWIVQAGYEFAAPFRFEYIDSSIAKDDYCEVDLYQPIKEKGDTPEKEFIRYSMFERR